MTKKIVNLKIISLTIIAVLITGCNKTPTYEQAAKSLDAQAPKNPTYANSQLLYETSNDTSGSDDNCTEASKKQIFLSELKYIEVQNYFLDNLPKEGWTKISSIPTLDMFQKNNDYYFTIKSFDDEKELMFFLDMDLSKEDEILDYFSNKKTIYWTDFVFNNCLKDNL